MDAFRRWVENRLGGYRHHVNAVDLALPLELVSPRRVAVVGAGLAGLVAATTLARRGFSVVLYEQKPYLGGKIGAWPVTLPSGELQTVEHGFHAFFHHYHNLNAFLDSLGLRRGFRTIEDYVLLALDGRRFSFRDVDRTPVLNILSMAKTKVWRWSQLAKDPRLLGLLAMLKFDADTTFERFDGLSYKAWADKLGLPPPMRLMFGSFSRAFFASPDRMSAAELLKSFHSFFLSHDGGLLYDYPGEHYKASLFSGLQGELDRTGVNQKLGCAVESLERTGEGFVVQGEPYDDVILAANATAVRRLVESSKSLGDAALLQAVQTLVPSQGYAVLRLWTDRVLETTLPCFVITEHREVLDSVSFYHDIEEQSRLWSQKTGGGVYELHCYALPDSPGDDLTIRNRLIEEFLAYFPELKGMVIVRENLQVNRDFTALHVGLHRDRPTTATATSGLHLAGDWVKLPFPAMLMEAAASSGLLAANAVLTRAGLREEPVWSVPPRGLLAKRR